MKKDFNISYETLKSLFDAGYSDREMAYEFGCSANYFERCRLKFGLIRKRAGNTQAVSGNNYVASFGRIKGHTWDTQLNGKFEDDPRACERDYVRYCGYVAIQKREAIC